MCSKEREEYVLDPTGPTLDIHCLGVYGFPYEQCTL